MMLQIDGGNTRFKWRVVSKTGGVITFGSVNREALDVDKFIATPDFKQLTQVIIASVSMLSLVMVIVEKFRIRLGVSNVYLVESSSLPKELQFAYDDITRLGVDRCLVMLAAYKLHPKGVVVLDSGSALTVDVVDRNGRHLGGYILPGYQMLRNVLLAGTSRVFVDGEVGIDCSLGDSTETCVANGVHAMLAATLAYVESLAVKHQISNIVITGGDAPLIIGLAKAKLEYQKDLVFQGLDIVSKLVFKNNDNKV
jgi:type III pantothenate kinase